MSLDGLRRYHYRNAFNGFFEFPTPNARRILPRFLQPVEPHHGSSVLAVTAFEFTESEVGAYGEVVLSVLVAPRIVAGEAVPRSAMYPFMVGTTSRASRLHGIEVWRLPHHGADLEVRVTRESGTIRVDAAERGHPILGLTVKEPPGVPWRPVEHRYQTFSTDDSGAYVSTLYMAGEFVESEEELGLLTLHPHAFTEGIQLDEVTTTPFREQWMRDGVETIHPLQALPALAER